MHEIWWTQQVTMGNVLVVLSMVANIGYQMRRLGGIERDLEALKVQARTDKIEIEQQLDVAARTIEATYSRKDVQAETMERISQSLAAIATQQAEIRTELREMRQRQGHP